MGCNFMAVNYIYIIGQLLLDSLIIYFEIDGSTKTHAQNVVSQ